jgi:hypothetical protein
MSFEYDPKISLQHYPLPMARFGLNPFGENLYRIVLASSRRHLVGGSWRGSGCGYHWVPKYRTVKAAWILERWRSAWDFTRMTRTQWDCNMVDPISGWLLLGPYPSRGEYDLAWEFDKGVDADNIDQVIAAAEKAHNERTFEDVRQAHKAEYEQEERDVRRESRAEIRDCVTAFGNAPMSARGHGRGSKTAPILRSAEQLGLRRPRASRTPLGVDVKGIAARQTLMAGRV